MAEGDHELPVVPRFSTENQRFELLQRPDVNSGGPRFADAHPSGDLCQAEPFEVVALDRALLLFGEDVAKKGGVYGVTRGLEERFGPKRVFNTLLDEQHVLGLALGTSMLGLLPVAEIQYLAFLHNAEDQLRGEAALLPFLSRGAYDNPLVVRIAGFTDPRGRGRTAQDTRSP